MQCQTSSGKISGENNIMYETESLIHVDGK